MSWIIFIHINAICLQAVTAYDMKLGYLINDGNASYKREMEINQEMNILKIHTLAHHEVLESYSMQNFQKLNEVNSISRAHTHTTIGRELFHVDKDEMVDPSILEGDLRAFYHGFGFPLYKEKKIQDDAKILNNRSIKAGRRLKRGLTYFHNDCYGQNPTTKYGVTSETSSNRLQICNDTGRLNGQWVFPDCDNVSVNSPHAYMCICCPYVTYIVTTRNDCVCTRMGRGR